MLVTTFERIAAHLADVTPEQIGKCHKLFGPDNQPFYAVENERGDIGLDNEVIEYSVRYSEQRGYTCTCPAGAQGFVRVYHRSGVCKHVRWTVAAVLEERTYMAELEAKQQTQEEQRRQAEQTAVEEAARIECEAGTRPHYLEINGKEASPREYARVMNAQPFYWTVAEIKRDQQHCQSRPFNLMK